MTTNPFPTIRVRAVTKELLEKEAERRRKKDGAAWSMDKLINALYQESRHRKGGKS